MSEKRYNFVLQTRTNGLTTDFFDNTYFVFGTFNY